jgi:hypothetical protein
VFAVKIAVRIANPALFCSTDEEVMVPLNKACAEILERC